MLPVGLHKCRLIAYELRLDKAYSFFIVNLCTFKSYIVFVSGGNYS